MRAALASGLVLVCLCALHLRLGAIEIPMRTIARALVAYDPGQYDHVVVVRQRLTRLAVALYAGASLSVSGLILQKILRNGLVSPSTLGINAGATTAVVVALFFFGVSGGLLFLPALAGAGLALGLSFAVARLIEGQGERELNLVLAGSMMSILFSSLTAFVLSLDPDAFANVISWVIGDIGNFDHESLGAMAPLGAAGLAGALLLSRPIDMLTLGREEAGAMGVDVPLIHGAALAAAVILAVSAVVVVGPIGFLGLILPHVARLCVGEIGRLPVWICAAGGAATLVAADILARVILAPQVLNVGTVMGLAGGAVFLGLVLSRMRGRRA